MVTLIDSTVSVTTRHSDKVPIASEAAMALANRGEATGAGWFRKPTVPGNRIMFQILRDAGESLRDFRQLHHHGGQYCGGGSIENGGIGAMGNVVPTVVNFWQRSRANVSGQAPAAIRAGSSTSARQSMVTKPGVCSTRRSQARMAGKVARS